MKNKIPFILWLVCEHCNNRTVLFKDIDDTESKCANGNCEKISKLDREAKFNAYINFLESEYLDLKKKSDILPPVFVKNTHLCKTKTGWRMVLNTKDSIQWALTQNINDL